jgi:hypothetical protein
MKYIVCRIKRDGEFFMDVPIMFPDMLVHSMVFSQMRSLLEIQYFKNGTKTEVEPLSAGDFSSTAFMAGEERIFHGKSSSLGVASREVDDRLIGSLDYGSSMMEIEEG